MQKIKRIAIIGNAGSGKSTIAKKLHAIYKLPLYHLDQYYFKPNWIKRDRDEYKKFHDSLCDTNEWIIEGINLKLLDYRAQRADLIIFLDLPRYTCLWSIFKRTLYHYGKVLPTSAPGCYERFNSDYIKVIMYIWNFKKIYPPKINELFTHYMQTKKLYTLKSRKEAKNLLRIMTMEYHATINR